MRPIRTAVLPLAAAVLLAGCISLGGKPPAALLALTPASLAQPDAGATVPAGSAVTVAIPIAPQELLTTRVPVHDGATTLTYVKGAQWVDQPARLFRDLLAQTIAVRTGRPVLDPRQSHLATGPRVGGRLTMFGIDAGQRKAMVRFEATLERTPGALETRLFEASAPVATIDAAGAGAALDQAANQAAADVADWIGR